MYISGDDSSCNEPDIFLCSDDDSGSISTCYFINNYIVGGMHAFSLTTEGDVCINDMHYVHRNLEPIYHPFSCP